MHFRSIVVCPFVLFLLAIVLSVLLRFPDSDYPFGIFKLFLVHVDKCWDHLQFNCMHCFYVLCSMLPMSLNCPFLVILSVFSITFIVTFIFFRNQNLQYWVGILSIAFVKFLSDNCYNFARCLPEFTIVLLHIYRTLLGIIQQKYFDYFINIAKHLHIS